MRQLRTTIGNPIELSTRITSPVTGQVVTDATVTLYATMGVVEVEQEMVFVDSEYVTTFEPPSAGHWLLRIEATGSRVGTDWGHLIVDDPAAAPIFSAPASAGI